VSGKVLAGCADCDGKCCRELVVDLTAAEVRGIADATGLNPADFVRFLHKPPSQVVSPPFRMGPQDPGVMLALDKKNDGSDGCVFLVELSGGQGRCGIYADRPPLCRVYPFHPNKLRVGIEPRCDGVCSPANWTFAAVDLLPLRRDVLWIAKAWVQHRQVVAQWNAMVDEQQRDFMPAELFDFLLAREDLLPYPE
jgi:Fe-S-cluster containining protein